MLNNKTPAVPQLVANEKEFIICSAIHFDDGKEYEHQPINIKTGIVVSGMRHHNCFATLAGLEVDWRKFKTIKQDKFQIQGFITSTHRFVDRKEGGTIAFAAGQIPKETDMLFSEDLY